MGETSENGRSATVAVYGTPDQLALLLASVVQIVEREPDSSYEDADVREMARQLAGTLHERLAATSPPEGEPA